MSSQLCGEQPRVQRRALQAAAAQDGPREGRLLVAVGDRSRGRSEALPDDALDARVNASHELPGVRRDASVAGPATLPVLLVGAALIAAGAWVACVKGLGPRRMLIKARKCFQPVRKRRLVIIYASLIRSQVLLSDFL